MSAGASATAGGGNAWAAAAAVLLEAWPTRRVAQAQLVRVVQYRFRVVLVSRRVVLHFRRLMAVRLAQAAQFQYRRASLQPRTVDRFCCRLEHHRQVLLVMRFWLSGCRRRLLAAPFLLLLVRGALVA